MQGYMIKVYLTEIIIMQAPLFRIVSPARC